MIEEGNIYPKGVIICRCLFRGIERFVRNTLQVMIQSVLRDERFDLTIDLKRFSAAS